MLQRLYSITWKKGGFPTDELRSTVSQAVGQCICIFHDAQVSFAGLELFFVDAAGPGTSARTPSVFFAFRSELDRDRAARAIAQQPSLGVSLPGGRDVASACGSILEVS